MRFLGVMVVSLAAACGGLPDDRLEGDSCFPDPSEARAVVNVVVRSETDDVEAASNDPETPAKWLWVLGYESEAGDAGSLNETPSLNKEEQIAGAFDVLRGQRATFSVTPGPSLQWMDEKDPVHHTVTLDRSCELVIVVSDEWDG